jgi:CHAT domain-containing protein/tetratricopeptide (TPR) repeat protein
VFLPENVDFVYHPDQRFMRSSCLGVSRLLVSIAFLSACQPTEPPAVSLEQAKQISRAFVAASSSATRPAVPPRSTADIAALLDQLAPDEDQVRNLRSLATAPEPAIATGRDAARLLADRGRARDELGETKGAIDDYKRSVAIYPDRPTLLRLAKALLIVGQPKDSLHYFQVLISDIEAEGSERGRLFSAYGLAALIHANLGDFAAAEDYVKRAEALLSEAVFWSSYPVQGARWASMVALGRAELEHKRGNLDAAQAAMDESVRHAEATIEREELENRKEPSPFPRMTGYVEKRSRRSLIMLDRGDVIGSEIESRRAIEISLQSYGKASPQTAMAVQSLTLSLLEQGRFVEAEKLSRIAADMVERSGQEPTSSRLGSLKKSIANALLYQGKPQAAADAFDTLDSALSADTDTRNRILGSSLEFGEALLATGQIAEARKHLSSILDTRRASFGEKNYLTAEATGYLAAATASGGNTDAALQLFERALPILTSVSRAVGNENGSARRLYRKKFILERYLAALAAAYPQGAEEDRAQIADTSFRVADILRDSSVQRALTSSSARAAATDPALAELVRGEQDALIQIAALNGVLIDALGVPFDQQDRLAIEKLRADIDSLRGARAVLREDIERRFPTYVDFVDPRPATIEQVRAALADDEALIASYVSTDRTYIWTVTRDSPPTFYEVPLGKGEIGSIVSGLRASLDPNAITLGDIPRFDVSLAHDLYRQLLAPSQGALTNVKELLLVQHGALGEIPFSILVTRPFEVQPDVQGEALFASYRPVPFLVREFGLTQLPSVASLVSLRRMPAAPPSRRPFIGFGDPIFSVEQTIPPATTDSRTSTAVASANDALTTRGIRLTRRNSPATQSLDSAELSALPRLPDTADELRAIAVALQANPETAVLVGAKASEQAVRSMTLSDRKVIMFATHGLVPGDLNGLSQPALAMSAPEVAGTSGDGLLTVDEIIGLRIDADWVVLSACNTASANGAGAEAVSGLGRAFFYAGTRALLVTNWPVETSSARALTTSIFRHQTGKSSLIKSQALRLSMLELIDGPGFVDPTEKRTVFSYAHPIFWAPFSLIGDNGNR